MGNKMRAQHQNISSVWFISVVFKVGEIDPLGTILRVRG